MSVNESFRRIARNRRLFDEVADKAKNAYEEGDCESAMSWAKVAAHFASVRHPGIYASPELENLLLEIAQKVPNDPPKKDLPINLTDDKSRTNKRRFLHIVTECYLSGGHTPFIARWIENTKDNSVIHSLVTTNQIAPMPELLTNAVGTSGGFYLSLRELAPTFMEQAQLLRSIAYGWADAVVLFVHPFDPLPVVAFGQKAGPPVFFCNHADHAFWFGTSIADVIFDYHPSATQLGKRRRGQYNAKLLPIPLTLGIPENKSNMSRSELGFTESDIIVLTIGREEKFVSFENYSYLDTMVKVLRAHPNVKLVAVGPSPQGIWKKASASVQNRIVALGTINRATLEKYYGIADLYVPSFPCGSGTAMLEAGLHSIPLWALNVAFLPHFSGGDELAFIGTDVYTSSLEDFMGKLESILLDATNHKDTAVAVKENIVRVHCPPGWNNYLTGVLEAVPLEHSVKPLAPIRDELDESDVFWEKMGSNMMFNELPEASLSRLLQAYKAYLPQNETRSLQAKYLRQSFIKIDGAARFRQFTRSFIEYVNSP